MIESIGQVLPLAVVLALSTVPLTVIVTILLSPRATASSWAFAIGWVVGLFVVTGALALGANLIPSQHIARPTEVIAGLEIALGLALVAYAVIAFVRARNKPSRTEAPRWLDAIGGVRPVPAVGLAFALCLRPKGLLVCSAAAIAIGATRNDATTGFVVLLVFVGIAASTVLVPVIVSFARPDAMRGRLQAAKRWIVANSRTVTFVGALLIGVVIIGRGMTEI